MLDLLALDDEAEPVLAELAAVWREYEGVSHGAVALAFLKCAAAGAIIHENETGEVAEWAVKVLNGLIGDGRKAQVDGRVGAVQSVH